MAGDFVGGMLTGVGDYAVKQNVLMSGTLPEIVNIGDQGSITVRFQEFIRDIYSADNPGPNTSGPFRIDSFLLNPGDANTFPWLSQIASNFEQYEFEGIVFGFKSMSGDALNSVNTALGTVMMCTQYDVNDAVFSSKAEMLNYEFSTAIKPSASTLHMIECARNQTVLSDLYVLPANQTVPSNSDPRFYYLGRTSIASQGLQGDQVNFGELHVTYQVRLMKPKLVDTLGQSLLFGNSTVSGTAGQSVYTNAFPLGSGPGTVVLTGACRTSIIVSPTTNQIFFPVANFTRSYLLNFTWSAVGGAGSAFQIPALTTANGCVIESRTSNDGTAVSIGKLVVAVTTQSISDQPPYITFPVCTLPPIGTGVMSFTVNIIEVNPNAF